MFRRTALIALVFGLLSFGQYGSVLHDREDAASPGVIRLLGVTRADSVELDGEVVHPEGLARTRYNLLIAPGTYTISIRLADSNGACTSQITVRPNETVAARCPRNQNDSAAD